MTDARIKEIQELLATGKAATVFGHIAILKAEAARAQEEERAIRKVVFDYFFPSPAEGTNTVEQPDGSKVKGVYPMDRKVDKAVLDVLRQLKLRDLEPADLERLHINPSLYTGDEPVLDVVRLNPDTVINWKPDLAAKVYKALTAEQRYVFDRCVTSKPGSISLEFIPAPPAADNAGQGNNAPATA